MSMRSKKEIIERLKAVEDSLEFTKFGSAEHSEFLQTWATLQWVLGAKRHVEHPYESKEACLKRERGL